jgi:GT2 family glycosyltransferase
MSVPDVGVIVTTYNWPEAIDACLASIAAQSIKPSQIIVADDGSTLSTEAVISRWRRLIPVVHCWVPDVANRPAVVRNRAAVKAEAELLVFIDGDCILSPNFLAWHQRLAKPRTIVSGGRLLLSETETTQYLSDNVIPDRVLKSFKYKEVELGALRDRFNNSISTVRTCNMGISKSDFLSCDGFDESYVGWAREDTDFVLRAVRSGISIRSGRCACNMFHLYHGGDKGRISPNDWRLDALIADPCRTAPKKSCCIF